MEFPGERSKAIPSRVQRPMIAGTAGHVHQRKRDEGQRFSFRRVMFAILVASPLLGPVHAQGAPLPPSRFGVTAGVNFAKAVGDEIGDVAARKAFVGGLMLVLPVTPNFSIQPELLYSMKGEKISEDQNFEVTVKLHYLEIPLLGRFDPPTTGGLKPFIYGGPAISFKTSCDVEAKRNGASIDGPCEEEGDDDSGIKSVDYSAVVGGGFAFDVQGRELTLGVRLTRGLVSIASDSDVDVKNQVIAFVASFAFPWKR
jgi:hypothetical protein